MGASVFNSALSVVILFSANLLLFFAAGQVRGKIAEEFLKPYYEATQLWHRLLVAGLVYALIIGPATYAFRVAPSASAYASSIAGALLTLGLVIVLAGKPLTLHIALATAVVAVGATYLAWAVS